MASNRTKVRLQSTESPHYYVTDVSKAYGRNKLRLKKYDPVVRRHVWYEEKRLKK
jgi:large subunit ribosomal protein L33